MIHFPIGIIHQNNTARTVGGLRLNDTVVVCGHLSSMVVGNAANQITPGHSGCFHGFKFSWTKSSNPHQQIAMPHDMRPLPQQRV
jgi:hypothetical protein